MLKQNRADRSYRTITLTWGALEYSNPTRDANCSVDKDGANGHNSLRFKWNRYMCSEQFLQTHPAKSL
jgi:hypothetical protein